MPGIRTNRGVRKFPLGSLLKPVIPTYYADYFPETASSSVPITKLGVFTPVSSTVDTITLSVPDAACIDIMMALTVKFANGKYKNCLFSSAVANTITLMYSYGEVVDLTNAVGLMAIHDTIRGGNGQHMSPWGYRAYAQELVAQLTAPKYYKYLNGYEFRFCSLATGFADKTVRDSLGNLLCTPTTNAALKTGGNTGINGIISGGTVANACSISTVTANRNGYNWSSQAYGIVQGTAGAYIQFPISGLKNFKGKLSISALCPNIGISSGTAITSDFNGTARMIVTDNLGTEIYNQLIPKYADIINIPLADKEYNNLFVKFQIEENKNTKVIINYMALYEDINVSKPVNQNSVVAFLGSSNTQKPQPSESYIAIVAGDTDNNLVVMTDATNGDGYGYFPKEFGRASGATVDNWGKSGMDTVWGLTQLDKIFSTKHYTHIVLTLFGNDLNAGTSLDVIKANILQMANYAIAHKTIPIIVMSYGTASSIQVVTYSGLHDALITQL